MNETKLTPELKEFLEKEGYKNLKEIEGRGICGLKGFMFTVAIVHGLDSSGYLGRWCYPHAKSVDCVAAFMGWDGKGDPEGDWIKYKGRTEYQNPNIEDEYIKKSSKETNKTE